MRRLLAILLTLFILSITAILCFAAEITAQNGIDNHGVFAQYHRVSDQAVYTTNLTDNAYVVKAEGNIAVTVTPSNPDNTLKLVLHVVSESEREAYTWFADCTKNYGGEILPLDIYFTDENGSRAEMSGFMDVSGTVPRPKLGEAK